MKFMSAVCFVFLFAAPFAEARVIGTEGGNGGDPCENRIQGIRDDLRSWIDRGGPKELVLPAGMSVEAYSRGMLAALNTARLACTDEKLMIADVEKTCVNQTMSETGSTPLIVCQRKTFQQATPEQQYPLIHHEFAGLAGIETNATTDSKYTVSDQTAAFLETSVTKRLALVRPASPAPAHTRVNFSAFAGHYRIVHCEQHISVGEKREANPESDNCAYHFADIYFAGEFHFENESDDNVHLNFTNVPGCLQLDAWLAYEQPEPGDRAITFPGTQYYQTSAGGHVQSVSIQEVGGLTYLTHNLSSQLQRDEGHKLFRTVSLILERIELPVRDPANPPRSQKGNPLSCMR